MPPFTGLPIGRRRPVSAQQTGIISGDSGAAAVWGQIARQAEATTDVLGKMQAQQDAIELARVEVEGTEALMELREQHADDPDAFRRAAEAYAAQKAGSLPGMLGERASIVLGREVNQQINSIYSRAREKTERLARDAMVQRADLSKMKVLDAAAKGDPADLTEQLGEFRAQMEAGARMGLWSEDRVKASVFEVSRAAAMESQTAFALTRPREFLDRYGTGKHGGDAVPVGGDDAYFRALRVPESGGDPTAFNPAGGGQGARGLYQFRKSTWDDLARRHPELRLSDDGWRGSDTNAQAQQERAIRALTADNAKALTDAGFELTWGNLYLAHFAGPGDAVKVLRAADGEPVKGLLHAESYRANPVVHGMTAGDLKAWTTAKIMEGGEIAAPDKAKPGDTQAGPQFAALISDVGGAAAARLVAMAERRIEADRREAWAALEPRMRDEVAMRAHGEAITSPITEAEVAAAGGPDALREWRRETTVADLRAQFATMSPQQEAAALAAMTPDPSSPGYAAQQERQDRAAQALAAKRQAIRDDPAAYALQTFPEVRAAIQDAAGGGPEATATAVSRLRDAQAHLGVPEWARRSLTKAQADTVIGRLESDTGENRADLIAGLQSQYGAAWPGVYADLVRAKMPSEYRILATIDDPVARVRMAEAFRAERESKGGLRRLLPDGAAQDIDKAVADEMATFAASLLPAPNGIALAADYMEAAKLLAYRYAAQGDGDPAVRAVENVATGRHEFLEQKAGGITHVARAPKDRFAAVEATARRIRDGLTAAEVVPLPHGPNLTDAQAAEITADAARRGYWLNNENDNGWFLMSVEGNPVLYMDGNRVEFRFDQARPGDSTAAAVAPRAGVVAAPLPPGLPSGRMQENVEDRRIREMRDGGR